MLFKQEHAWQLQETDVMFTKASESLLYIRCKQTGLHVDSLDHVWPQWQPWGLH